ncbi:MAG: DNA-3-methyladenine glycosylase 2 family protein, partial [Eubacterium sp.]|nr:DNA-3-methyladenine glycosylase 2 family protein [Eubacterium sp.]
ISFIISQNKSIPAIKRSVELLCEVAESRREDAEGSYYLFPTPEEILALSDEALSACRLGYRCRYVKAAALDVAEGKLNLCLLKNETEESTIKALTAVCGVGVKVANCVSLFGLHHIDAFPVDVWIRRILENKYPSGYPKERYSPYNGIYQQYMFYYYRAKHGKE